MKPKYQLLILLFLTTVTANAQIDKATKFTIGDTAPQLRVKEWIKGSPIKNFEKDRVYVVEFWATWCKPCIASMPHLSSIARKYSDKVTVLAIDVYEGKKASPETLKNFVDNMGGRMDFHVAIEDTSFTVKDWLEASNEKDSGIPISFVVNANGLISWMGHPKDIDGVLSKVLDNTWNIKDELAKRNLNRYLKNMDQDSGEKLSKYNSKAGDLGKPDSTLFVINNIIKKDPALQYAPIIALFTFEALLKTNMHKAYEFGKTLIQIPTYEEPAYDAIISNINEYADRLDISQEIYRLGAEACQAEIDNSHYPELLDLPKKYQKIAAWYRLGLDEQKAKDAELNAIKYSITYASKQTE